MKMCDLGITDKKLFRSLIRQTKKGFTLFSRSLSEKDTAQVVGLK